MVLSRRSWCRKAWLSTPASCSLLSTRSPIDISQILNAFTLQTLRARPIAPRFPFHTDWGGDSGGCARGGDRHDAHRRPRPWAARARRARGGAAHQAADAYRPAVGPIAERQVRPARFRDRWSQPRRPPVPEGETNSGVARVGGDVSSRGAARLDRDVRLADADRAVGRRPPQLSKFWIDQQ